MRAAWTTPRGRLAVVFGAFTAVWFLLTTVIGPGLHPVLAGDLHSLLYDGWALGVAGVGGWYAWQNRARGWIAPAAALALLALGDTLWDLSWHGVISLPAGAPSVMDACYLPSYLALALTMFWLVRRYDRRRGLGHLLDATIVAVGAAAAVLPLVLDPYVDTLRDGSLGVRLAYPLYPVGGTLLTAACAVVLVAAPGIRAVRLLGVACGLRMVADQAFAVRSLTGAEAAPAWLDWLWLAGYTVLAMALTCPLPRRPKDHEGVRANRRFAMLSAAAMLCPALLVGVHLLGAGENRELSETLYGFGTLLLTALVLARLLLLLRENRGTVDELRAALAEGQKLHRELDHQARHDMITGLPNRFQLAEQADAVLADDAAREPGAAERADADEAAYEAAMLAEQRAGDPDEDDGAQRPPGGVERRQVRPDGRHTVVFLDLDDFKAINDTFGHATGDMVLRAIGDRLRQVCRPTDVVARLGGDEFAVLLFGCSTDQGSVVAERMLRLLGEPLIIAGRPVSLGASAGIATLRRGHGRYADALAEADVAMYAAKRAGKNRVLVFREEMRRDLLADTGLAADLTKAIREGAIGVAYQPVVQLATGRISGCEALARWRHPERGNVSPGTFLPLATERGLVAELDLQIMDKALAQVRRWRGSDPRVRVAVNASAQLLGREDLPALVLRLLERHELPGDALTVEVTEQSVIDDAEAVAGRLEELRTHGVHVALDDFGTGYSSLSALQDLPVDVLKLDRSFLVRGVGDGEVSPLVRTVVRLGHELGMQVVAEGIETQQQYAAVREVGCDFGQGYLMARPMPAEDVEQLLSGIAAAPAAVAGAVVGAR